MAQRKLDSFLPILQWVGHGRAVRRGQGWRPRALIGLSWAGLLLNPGCWSPSPWFPPSPPDAQARPRDLGPPPLLPFPAAAPIDVVPLPRPGLGGPFSPATIPPLGSGTVWQSDKGAGFGWHDPQNVYLLGEGAWLMVQADSGLWFLESQTLARRARLRTGMVPAVDVSKDGSRIAYADCEMGEFTSQQRCDLVVRSWPQLSELYRTAVKWPTQVRFSPSGQLVATSRGLYGGATVVPLDGAQPRFDTQLLTTAVAAIPLRHRNKIT